MEQPNSVKVFDGIDEITVSTALNELNKEQHIFIDCKFLELNEKTVMLYKKRDTTQPPESDLKKNVPPPEVMEQLQPEVKTDFVYYLKEYWYLAAVVAGFAVYYLHKGGYI